MPRAGLTPALVARTAADLADEAGWDQLTLAAVADRLGVRQPSLYKHIESLAALRRAVSRLAVTELGEHLVVAVAGRSGMDALMNLALAYRGYAHRHPGRYAASIIAPVPEDVEHTRVGEAVVRTIAATLRGYGLADGGVPGGAGALGDETPGEDALHAIRALRAMLHGFVALEAAGGFALSLDLDESYRRMVVGFDAAMHARGASAVDGASSGSPVTAR